MRDLHFVSYGDGTEVAQGDVVFLAQENGKAMETAPHLLQAGCKIVDLSADFRFRDPATYEVWYKAAYTAAEWNERAVYGLPELHRDAIARSSLVGNPGCYTTASILALAPLVADQRIELNSIVIDAKSGVSGAGRAKFALDYHFPETNESVSAYKIAGTHRHTPEIEQELSQLAGEEIRVSFTPHLIPMTRGILATCYATLKTGASAREIFALYQEFYAGAPFVTLIEDGLPATKHTLGSNRCHIGMGVDSRTNRVTIVSCIDNLIKGASGQAIQNMNLMFGWEETAGLSDLGGLWP
jgi:N-acetyl-gamma-glutamyl-phosphate reductase